MLKTGVHRIPKAFLFICCVAFVSFEITLDVAQAYDNVFAPVDRKLEVQFDLYDQAREKITQRVVDEYGTVQREEWETWLTPEPGDVLDEEELSLVAGRQAQIIQESRDNALASSSLRLDLLRIDSTKLAQYCLEFPKGGMLHIHPTGTRSRQTMIKLLEELNPEINGAEILAKANDGELTQLYPSEIDFLSTLPVMKYLEYSEEEQDSILAFFFLPDEPPIHDFMRFESIFSINELLKQDESKARWVEETTYLDFLNRCAEQNVRYVEFTKVMWPSIETYEQLHTWAGQWYEETGVHVRWNSAFVRTLDFDTNSAWTNEFISILESHPCAELVGIDLLANETYTPALETGQNIYVPVLAANRQGILNIRPTMHAGELGLVSNVRDAMIMGVQRVGHGVLLAEDPVALEYAISKQLPIEINIYSNYRLQVNEDFSQHPFLDFLRLGLPVSLSTDDEGIFVTDITNEYMIAISYTDITHEELKQMSYNSITTSFADDVLKAELMNQLDEEFERFEAKWKGELDQ